MTAKKGSINSILAITVQLNLTSLERVRFREKEGEQGGEEEEGDKAVQKKHAIMAHKS